MNFHTGTRVSQIALSNPASRRVLEDAGIDYCCGGAKSLGDACREAKVPSEEILDRLRQNRQPAQPEEVEWSSAALADLTLHIQQRHHKYVRGAIPRLRGLLAKVRTKHAEKHPEVAEIERLFEEVASEMLMHMEKEEQILFPYIDALDQTARGNGSVEPPFFQTVRNPVQMMMQEHDSAGDLVRQIRKASRDYQPPEDACATFRAAFQELQQFEADLHLHVHLENNILFPRAAELEAKTF